MNLKEELKEIKNKRFIPYAEMANMVRVKPTSFYQWLYGNTTLAKNKQKALENFVRMEKIKSYEEFL